MMILAASSCPPPHGQLMPRGQADCRSGPEDWGPNADLLVVPAYPDVVNRYLRYPTAPPTMPAALEGMNLQGRGWHFPLELLARVLFGNVAAMWEASKLPFGCLLGRLPKAG